MTIPVRGIPDLTMVLSPMDSTIVQDARGDGSSRCVDGFRKQGVGVIVNRLLGADVKLTIRRAMGNVRTCAQWSAGKMSGSPGAGGSIAAGGLDGADRGGDLDIRCGDDGFEPGGELAALSSAILYLGRIAGPKRRKISCRRPRNM